MEVILSLLGKLSQTSTIDRMDHHGVQARLSNLRTAEVVALRKGDAEAAKRVINVYEKSEN